MSSVDVEIEGLDKLRAGLDEVAGETRQALDRLAIRWADLTVKNARRSAPGSAGRFIRASGAQVHAGGSRAPWFPWLDFGGRVGRNNSVRRRFIRQGRFVFPAMSAARERIFREMDEELRNAARSQGWSVR